MTELELLIDHIDTYELFLNKGALNEKGINSLKKLWSERDELEKAAQPTPKHTQGEWWADIFNVILVGPMGRTKIGQAYSTSVNDDNAEANAKLMAAAPDMLEALQLALSTVYARETKTLDEINLLDMIHTVINKATK